MYIIIIIIIIIIIHGNYWVRDAPGFIWTRLEVEHKFLKIWTKTKPRDLM